MNKQKELLRLSNRVKRLEKALKFYGYDTRIEDNEEHNRRDGVLIRAKRAILHIDNGKRARKALEDESDE